MESRNRHIDAVKGFAIFTVVVGHVIANFFTSWNDTLNNMPVAMYWWRLIYSFHMPLMIFISGYLFLSSRVFSDNLSKVWWHKVQPLLFPFVFMGIVLWLIKDEKESYWYLRTLLEFMSIQMVYEVIRKHYALGIKMDLIFVLLSWVFVNIYLVKFYAVPYFKSIIDISHIQYLWFYFSVGVLIRRYQLFIHIRFQHFESCIFLIFVAYLLANIGGGINFNIFLTQLFVLCGITAIFVAFDKYNQATSIMKAFQYMGKHTLEIYLIHGFFLLKIPFIGDHIIKLCDISVEMNNMKYQLTALTIEILFAVTVSVVNVALCAAVYEPLKAFPLIYRLFLGRKLNQIETNENSITKPSIR